MNRHPSDYLGGLILLPVFALLWLLCHLFGWLR